MPIEYEQLILFALTGLFQRQLTEIWTIEKIYKNKGINSKFLNGDICTKQTS